LNEVVINNEIQIQQDLLNYEQELEVDLDIFIQGLGGNTIKLQTTSVKLIYMSKFCSVI
jgi:hypothetical protein